MHNEVCIVSHVENSRLARGEIGESSCECEISDVEFMLVQRLAGKGLILATIRDGTYFREADFAKWIIRNPFGVINISHISEETFAFEVLIIIITFTLIVFFFCLQFIPLCNILYKFLSNSFLS